MVKQWLIVQTNNIHSYVFGLYVIQAETAEKAIATLPPIATTLGKSHGHYEAYDLSGLPSGWKFFE
jgi:hypothetical protein